MSDRVLCPDCQTPRDAGVGTQPKHTSPPNGSLVCQCGDPRCACFGIQVKAGLRTR